MPASNLLKVVMSEVCKLRRDMRSVPLSLITFNCLYVASGITELELRMHVGRLSKKPISTTIKLLNVFCMCFFVIDL